ncbi:MAG: ornithine carbamoyltransferase [Promethearchaeota archaeon CR_4]|nr:MAG: ornithine carbamoyltransferase [Candidatus Lokiarchaeota archaeon CR_4]
MSSVRHFRNLDDISPREMMGLLDLAEKIKKHPENYRESCKFKTLGMLFAKTSTRTRVSFEVGMYQMGGHAIYLDWEKTNFTLAKFEDEVAVLARYCDILMARVFEHDSIIRMARASSVPIINGLSNDHHPIQSLADLLTIREKFGSLEGITVAYVGDGNNVCHSLIWACSHAGVKCRISTPRDYNVHVPLPKNSFTWYETPEEAVKGVDIIYTDTWVSIGQEAETKARQQVFRPFQVNANLIAQASSRAIFMHCLPAHRGLEVSDEVFDGPQSVVFDQAENRLHTEKALILKLLGIEAW